MSWARPGGHHGEAKFVCYGHLQHYDKYFRKYFSVARQSTQQKTGTNIRRLLSLTAPQPHSLAALLGLDLLAELINEVVALVVLIIPIVLP